MILSFAKINPLPGKQQVVVDILRSVIGPTRVKSGCVDCAVYTNQGEGQTILYLEQVEEVYYSEGQFPFVWIHLISLC